MRNQLHGAQPSLSNGFTNITNFTKVAPVDQNAVLIKLKTLKTTKTSQVDLCFSITTGIPLRRVIRKSCVIEKMAERERSIINGPLADVGAIPKVLFFSDCRPELLTYKFITGRPLYQTYTNRHTPIQDVFKLFRATLLILGDIHSERIIHNDLSPGNLLIDKRNHVSIIDFGSATPYGCSEFLAIGKPHYASPEQIEHKPIDARSDIYQLGCVLFETIYKTQYLDANNRPYNSIDVFDNAPINCLLKLMLDSAQSKRITSSQECINIIDNLIYNQLV
ncbi:MAG: protein kinase [Arenicella sp.]|nr:protein kinase [Arenicella sp.]